ncbi:MAG: hypothetical protein RIM84_18610 [Alphaproteobacteria bacterium]
MKQTNKKGSAPRLQRAAGSGTGGESTAFKIKLRGKDGAPLSMDELRQGFYEIARKLAPLTACRAKWVTVYMTMVDEDGREVRIDEKGEWTIYPYRCAADDHGA